MPDQMYPRIQRRMPLLDAFDFAARFTNRLISLVAVALLMLTATANAQFKAALGGLVVVYSNFGPGKAYDNGGAWTINGFFNVDTGQQVISEQFAPTANYTFIDAQAAVNAINLSGGPNSINAFLQADSNGEPGAIIEEIPLTGLGDTPAIVTASSRLLPVLQQGTPYWLTLVAGAAGVLGGWYWNSISDESKFTFTANQSGSAAGPWGNPGAEPVSIRSVFEIDGVAEYSFCPGANGGGEYYNPYVATCVDGTVVPLPVPPGELICPAGVNRLGGFYDPSDSSCYLGAIVPAGDLYCARGVYGPSAIYDPSGSSCDSGVIVPFGDLYCPPGDNGPGGIYDPADSECHAGKIVSG